MLSKYLYGDETRLFLNTNLGCHAKCSYCYLPSLNIELGNVPKRKIEIKNLIESLNNNTEFKKGINGTILSIGCYSECWDAENRDDTIKLINILIEYKNPIQLATKEYINKNDFTKINIDRIKYLHHLSIFISSSTITQYKKYENGTKEPKLRFKSFELKSIYNIPMYLYIKPVLENITIVDIDLYIQVIEQYKIDTIVGDLFTNKGLAYAPIGEKKLFYQNKKNDNNFIKNKFSQYCNVYKYSVEPILKGIANNG